MMASGSVVLTAEQEAVVNLPAEAMTLVTAGPGAGKTHTLVERLARLVIGGVEASDILVLTFSRNAVAELRRRLKGHLATRGMRVQTFDAWALDILLDVDSARDWSAVSFDDRISAATQAIRDGRTDGRHDTLAHVVVDETQDLVGVRRELVEELLTTYDCGFTVVGDVAQSIYGFQIEDPAERDKQTGRFAEQLRTAFGSDLVECSLTLNHRAETDEVRVALPYGNVLRRGSASDPKALWRTMRDELTDVLALGALTDSLTLDYLRDPGSTAVLCRTNGEALLVSEALHAAQVPHTLRRGARDRVVPPWVADLLGPTAQRRIGRESFEEAVATSGAPAVDPDEMWAVLLRSAGDASGRALDAGRLRRAVASDRVPDELTAQPPADLVISSFHRAKGLEFDRVVVVEPRLWERDDIDYAEEARLLFVALTRARAELLRLGPQVRWNIRHCRASDRWLRHGRESWMRFGMEVVDGDIDTLNPPGSDPRAVQAYLRREVNPGDPIVLERAADHSLENGQSPPCRVLHRGMSIGTVSSRFRTHLRRILKINQSWVPRYPRQVEQLRVDAVEAVAGSEASGVVAGLGEYGVWRSVRVGGIGRFVFDKKGVGEQGA